MAEQNGIQMAQYIIFYSSVCDVTSLNLAMFTSVKNEEIVVLIGRSLHVELVSASELFICSFSGCQFFKYIFIYFFFLTFQNSFT